MGKSKVFQVNDNRIQFKCSKCQARRNLPVPPMVRTKSVRCHKCGEVSLCLLNRRSRERQSQSGKATIVLREGKELDIHLHDISANGVGFNISMDLAPMLSLKQEVQFNCGWNPRLFKQGRYVVKNISGQRIGVQNVAQKGLH